jgi:hypothetical protein
MKKPILYAAVAAVMTGCFGPKEMQIRVAPLGEEVPETQQQYLYVLHQSVLKVVVVTQEVRSVPGPYVEFAAKYLGIGEVIRQNSTRWQILDVDVTRHEEMDPGMVYQINVLEGQFDPALLEPLMEQGVILDGTSLVQEGIKSNALGVSVKKDYLKYVDLGVDSNFEVRTETMYKTIVTDTSFVSVPVDRTITEQKSPARKAEEAANFILELRTRRFELLTGGYEGFPQGEAMSATLDKLDKLEEAYLSLFTGKTLITKRKVAWFVVPQAGTTSSTYPLGMFSEQLGFVPDELLEGKLLQIRIDPLGKTLDIGSYYAGKQGAGEMNQLVYRLPDVVLLQVELGNDALLSQRISIYQSGALIASPIK